MPVDVRGVVGQYASVEEIRFPPTIGCDAVVALDKATPKIFLNSRRPTNRQRFTLAHELGHVLLPWHAGPSICDPNDRLQTPGNSGPEGEANVFASEILVPRRDLLDISGGDAPTERLLLTAEAKISDAARMRAVADSLDPGYAFVLCDRDRVVLATVVSPGTHTPTEYPGQTFVPRAFLKDADAHDRVQIGTRFFYWWYLAPPSASERKPGTLSKTLLAQILSDVAAEFGIDAKAEQPSIAGIIGAANGRSTASTADELVAELRHRFVQRDHLAEIMQHRLWNAFLWSRADELMLGRADGADS